MRPSTLLTAVLAFVCCLLLPEQAKGQSVSGYTSIDYYQETNTVDAYSETTMDFDLSGDYDAKVLLQITDQNYNIINNRVYSDQDAGTASVDVQFSGTSGDTYTATGGHWAVASLSDYYSYYPYPIFYWDSFYLSYYENQSIFMPWYANFISPGYQNIERNVPNINLGGTYDSASTTLPFTINSVSPMYGVPGTVIQVTIDGAGFSPRSTVQVGGSGITVSGTHMVSSTQITANFTIDANATGGNVSVTVTNRNVPSNAVPFDIRVPHHLRVVADNIGFPSCPDTSPTVVREIQYEVLDVHGNVIASDISVMESFTSLTTNTCNSSQPSPQQCTQVGPNSIPFVDQLTVGCNTTIGSACGYDVDNKWQWCPSGRSPVTLASVHHHVRNNQILVNGAAQFQTGTEIFP